MRCSRRRRPPSSPGPFSLQRRKGGPRSYRFPLKLCSTECGTDTCPLPPRGGEGLGVRVACRYTRAPRRIPGEVPGGQFGRRKGGGGMARDEAYRKAERKIEEARLLGYTELF